MKNLSIEFPRSLQFSRFSNFCDCFGFYVAHIAITITEDFKWNRQYFEKCTMFQGRIASGEENYMEDYLLYSQ